MNHAITRDNVDGRDREFHSMTCKACEVERVANDIANLVTKELFPDEPFRHKWRIEGVVKRYLEEQWKTVK